MNTKKKTVFNLDWENSNIFPDFAQCIKSVKENIFQGQCTVCQKRIELSNMGRQAIISHIKSVGHRKKWTAMKMNNKITCFTNPINSQPRCQQLLQQSEQSSSMEPVVPLLPAQPPAVELLNFTINADVIDAEILWALNVVESHASFNSCDKSIPVMKKMFKDSIIAKKMTLGRTKVSYIINFGIGLYFKENLDDWLKSLSLYVICFDESLNTIIQKGQMDLHIRCFNEKTNSVETRYFNSVFLTKCTAEDILRAFKSGLDSLNLNKVLQVSMDGPNVNWKFLRLLKEDSAFEETKLVEIGSCGLHIIHGALQTGHKKVHWKVNEFLTGLYWIFKDSPVRRGEFTQITNENKFPKKFCKTRWVESSTVALRALEIIDSVAKYIKTDTVKLPTNISTSNVKSGLEDNLLKCKLAFFSMVAEMLEPFLTKYQSPKPLAPFLYDDLEKLIRNITKKFLKDNVTMKNLPKLIRVDMKDKNNLKDIKKIDVGFSTSSYLKNSAASEKDKLLFYKDCQTFLIAVTEKILERCCLKYKIVRGMSSLNPQLMIQKPEESSTRFRLLLQELHDLGRINGNIADKGMEQYGDFIRKEEVVNELTKFTSTDNLCNLFVKLVMNNKEYNHLWSIIKMVLIISHGNASVESGFSINKELLVENLLERSVISQRMVYDNIKHLNGSINVQITDKLRRYTRSSNMKYKEALNKKKDETADQLILRKRKECAIAEIKVLQKKKLKLQENTDYEESKIDSQLLKLRKIISE